MRKPQYLYSSYQFIMRYKFLGIHKFLEDKFLSKWCWKTRANFFAFSNIFHVSDSSWSPFRNTRFILMKLSCENHNSYTILLLFEDIHCRGFSQWGFSLWEFSLWRIIRVRSFSHFAVIVVTFIVIFMKTTTNTTTTTRINTLVSTDY